MAFLLISLNRVNERCKLSFAKVSIEISLLYAFRDADVTS